ncbi:hypothetical protein MTBBW1_2380050 [Desulfamplus magnetovallimortis]|uniref:Uncharacterized protein n=1 Tax=Desulfamplus magnetovallimortis TaxID=1246637 RepID=A0A1W1HE62_9BACT|nr:radical SAM protein [Desulfamplus magnetovallimortis]SLM30726.1 hypothetical protein MTBBW1_2380050 [Desulfamplus magnetovallimortis]
MTKPSSPLSANPSYKNNGGNLQDKNREKESYPKELSIVITTKCNMRCKVCLQQEFASSFNMTLIDKLSHVIPQLELLHPIGGEPLLCDLDPIYTLALKNNCKIKIITNGTLITDKVAENIVAHVDRLIVSIDGGTDAAYREMRGSSIAKPLKGIGKVLTQKAIAGKISSPTIEINYLLTRTTIDSLPELAQRAKILGIDYINLFYPAFSDQELKRKESIGPDMAKAKIKEAASFANIIEPENRGGEICRRPWNTCFIDVNGNVFGCCYGSPALGNLNHSRFDDCWFGPVAQNLRKTVNTDQEIPSCRKCIVRKRA